MIPVTETELEQFEILAAKIGTRPGVLARSLLQGFHADTVRMDTAALIAAARGPIAATLLN